MNPSERPNDNFEDEHDDEDEYDLRGKRKGDRSKSRGCKFRSRSPKKTVDSPSRNDWKDGRAAFITRVEWGNERSIR
jgi:hypothetical protein